VAQPVQVDLLAGPVAGILEHAVAAVLDRRLRELDPMRRVHGCVGELGQAERVGSRHGLRQVLDVCPPTQDLPLTTQHPPQSDESIDHDQRGQHQEQPK